MDVHFSPTLFFPYIFTPESKFKQTIFFSVTRGCSRKDDVDRTQRERRRLSDDS